MRSGSTACCGTSRRTRADLRRGARREAGGTHLARRGGAGAPRARDGPGRAPRYAGPVRGGAARDPGGARDAAGELCRRVDQVVRGGDPAGRRDTTDDATGEPLATSDAWRGLDGGRIAEALARFCGAYA